MIEIKSAKMSYGINFPTSVKELTPEVLETITNGVKLPKHYCIIALAFDTKVFDFCAAINSSRNTNVAVTPILAKIAQEDSKEINASEMVKNTQEAINDRFAEIIDSTKVVKAEKEEGIKGVQTGPGATALTRILSLANDKARDFVKTVIAPFVEE